MPRSFSPATRFTALLALVMALVAPLEQLVPDDCDGHGPAVPAELMQADHGSAPVGHLPDSAHLCHDVHNHAALVDRRRLNIEPGPLADDPSPPVVLAGPVGSHARCFRPPIA